MKKFALTSILAIIFSMFAQPIMAADTDVEFSVNNIDGDLATTMNVNISCLLTAFNEAAASGSMAPDIAGLFLSDEVSNQILKTWEDCPFKCTERDIVQSANKLKDGSYEVRDIPLTMMPRDQKTGTWKTYQDAILTIDAKGDVVGFRLAINPTVYAEVMSGAADVTEMNLYQSIMEYLERFRNAYCIKDLNFLEDVFSDDALIITGSVIKRAPSANAEKAATKVKYTQYSKKEYMNHLKSVFARNAKINVTFDQIEIKRHPAVEGLYGVHLYQGYTSSTYSDVGYLFLVWDFRDPEHPQIHIRTWQDERIWTENPNSTEEKFDIDSFDLSDF